MDLAARVRATIEKFQMIREGDTVLVGVSGGPDSVALLHVLWTLREDLRAGLHVVHLNHLLRGEEARADALFVRELAEKLGLPCTVEDCDVRTLARRTGLSLQEAAREARFAFFERERERVGASKVALGHHADDQAETILFNFLRGSGVSGLAGIPPVRGAYIRPFFEVRRREIEEYCRVNSLAARLDRSNLKPVYTRNRIRLHLLPFLEKEYNPCLVDALTRLGNICREEDAYLDGVSREILEKVASCGEEGEIVFPVQSLLAQPISLQRRIFRLAWKKVTGQARELPFHHIERLLALLSKRDAVLTLPWGVRAFKEGSLVKLSKNAEREKEIPPYRYLLNIPGLTFLPETGLKIKAEIMPAESAPSFRNLTLREALLDYGLLRRPLWVRRRKEGDVFSPLGQNGKVKLKKFFIDQKVPAEKRNSFPVVVTGEEEIVWVGGLRIADPWKVTEKTTECLYLHIMDINTG